MSQEERLEEIIEVLYDRIDELEKENRAFKREIEILSNYIDEQEKKMKSLSFNNDTVIKLMYSMYFKGNGFSKIAKYLNENKVLTKRGGTWSTSSVRFILKSPYNIKRLLNAEEKNNFYGLIAKNTKNKNILTNK